MNNYIDIRLNGLKDNLENSTNEKEKRIIYFLSLHTYKLRFKYKFNLNKYIKNNYEFSEKKETYHQKGEKVFLQY